jgi:hypothetical protein
MGIKFKPAPGPGPEHHCNKQLKISDAISSGSQNTFPPTNAIDNVPNTKW